MRVAGGELLARQVGLGGKIIVLHGGPSLDHRYLLPELDRLSDTFQLVYYDQRGRGRSLPATRSEDVTIETEMSDLNAVRALFCTGPPSLLGHSFGALLALEYAARFPKRVSRLVLVNPAPAAAADWDQVIRHQQAKLGTDWARLDALGASAEYKAADPATVAETYRLWFRSGVAHSADLDEIVRRLMVDFNPERWFRSEAIGQRLFEQTLAHPGYNLLPRLRGLTIPTLVIHSDHEFIPSVAITHIAESLPDAEVVTLKDCGHFSYLEAPRAFREALDNWLE